MKGRTVTVTIEDNSGNKTHQAFLDVTYNKLTVTTAAITNFFREGVITDEPTPLH